MLGPLVLTIDVGKLRFLAGGLQPIDSFFFTLPALRERREDIPLLVEHHLRRQALRLGRPVPRVTPVVMDALLAYAWPGNVRELENRMKRAVVMTDARLISAADLELAAPDDEADLDLRAARTRAERDVIQRALGRSGGTLAVLRRRATKKPSLSNNCGKTCRKPSGVRARSAPLNSSLSGTHSTAPG